MESLTQQQIDEYVAKDPKFIISYNARQRKGDIVEIQPDGFWTKVKRGFDKANFDLLVVAGLSAEEARQKYGGSLKVVDPEDETKTILKAKFKANIDLTVDEEQKAAIDKTVIDSEITTKTELSIG